MPESDSGMSEFGRIGENQAKMGIPSSAKWKSRYNVVTRVREQKFPTHSTELMGGKGGAYYGKR